MPRHRWTLLLALLAVAGCESTPLAPELYVGRYPLIQVNHSDLPVDLLAPLGCTAHMLSGALLLQAESFNLYIQRSATCPGEAMGMPPYEIQGSVIRGSKSLTLRAVQGNGAVEEFVVRLETRMVRLKSVHGQLASDGPTELLLGPHAPVP